MVLNVRSKQHEAVVRMLHLNGAPSTVAKGDEDAYKVLIMDRFCRNILSPLLRVNDLRKHGITLHLLVDVDRQPIPDVPAIYFLQPNEQNIDRVVQDAGQRRYDAMYINFSSSIPRPLMEHFAASAARADGGLAPQRISKVFDQYLSYVALERDLFSLGLPQTYLQLNDPTAGDAQVEASVSTVIEGLFSVLATLGVVPVIRCPRGGAAEHVASLLDLRIRDHLKARTGLFPEALPGAAQPRPVLALFDRNFDLANAVKHVWAYQPLVQDVLGLRLNRVTVTEAAGPAPPSGPKPPQPEKKSYEVGEDDFFWEENGGRPFPKIAEEVEVQLQRYRAAVEDVNRRAGALQGEGQFRDEGEMLSHNTKNLMSAVSSLPELTERKKVLDKHTNLATALLQEIKRRALDHFHSLEDDLLAGKADRGPVLEALNARKGTPEDRLRLALVLLLTAKGPLSQAEAEQMEAALAESTEIAALRYVRRMIGLNLTGGARPGQGAPGAHAPHASQGNLLDWANTTFGQGLSAVTKQMKSLLSGQRQSPVVTAVEQLMEGRAGSEAAEGFSIFDPRGPKGGPVNERSKGPFSDAIVFMIGGGNYEEYQELREWAARTAPGAGAGAGGAGAGAESRRVVYGATELLSGVEFLQQLNELGKMQTH